ncbi:MAG: cysteine methyltransferase [Gammaproteobacteria bacterium]|nr:cysteine methyltransferase [Gammaproteobacteria bacterium]
MTVYEAIYKIVKRIPHGNVTSYGRIARIVKCNPRQVGYAMAAIPNGLDIPWHRVVNSRGEISLRKEGYADHFQRQKLTEEGVVFDQRGRINFDRFGWIEVELPFLPEDWLDD